MRVWTGALLTSLTLAFFGCPQDPINQQAESLRTMMVSANMEPIQKPETNEALAELGRMLFFDKELSGNRNVSCATCHGMNDGTTDGIPLPKGEGSTGFGKDRVVALDVYGEPVFIPRNAPSLFNLADMTNVFWDDRVEVRQPGDFSTPSGPNLPREMGNIAAVQAFFPVTSRDEMRGQEDENELSQIGDRQWHDMWDGLAARIRAIDAYHPLLQAAYPGRTIESITFADLAAAIGEFQIQEFTLTDSPFDRFLAGDDSALTAEQIWGGELFFGNGNCASCHAGSLLSDEKVYVMAAPQLGPGKQHEGVDLGIAGIRPYAFSTPSLREVEVTGPYTHAGAYSTLEATVRHMLDPAGMVAAYDPSQHLTPEFQAMVEEEQNETIREVYLGQFSGVEPIEMTDDEVGAIVDFMKSMTSPGIDDLPSLVPDTVPSGLPVAD